MMSSSLNTDVVDEDMKVHRQKINLVGISKEFSLKKKSA